MRDYLTSASGLQLDPTRVLYLFDSADDSSVQLDRIARFLEKKFHEHNAPKGTGVTVILSYIGHGAFFGRERSYCLLVRETREPHLAATSIRVSDIAEALRVCAPESSRIVILDSCFAGSAFKDFQSDVEQIEYQKVEEVLNATDRRGVALLCAASARVTGQVMRVAMLALRRA